LAERVTIEGLIMAQIRVIDRNGNEHRLDAVEGWRVHWAWPMVAAIVFLVIGASILAVSALHVLMRHGAATRVTSLLYLTPVIAVLLEWLGFGVVPSALSMVGVAVVCAGVALVTMRR